MADAGAAAGSCDSIERNGRSARNGFRRSGCEGDLRQGVSQPAIRSWSVPDRVQDAWKPRREAAIVAFAKSWRRQHEKRPPMGGLESRETRLDGRAGVLAYGIQGEMPSPDWG